MEEGLRCGCESCYLLIVIGGDGGVICHLENLLFVNCYWGRCDLE